MEERLNAPNHRQPPLGGSLDFTPGLAWLLAGLRTCRLGPVRKRQAFLLTHLPGFGENQWCLGVRSCLPLRGSPGFAPGSLWTLPLETSPASGTQDTAPFTYCQPKCCGFSKGSQAKTDEHRSDRQSIDRTQPRKTPNKSELAAQRGHAPPVLEPQYKPHAFFHDRPFLPGHANLFSGTFCKGKVRKLNCSFGVRRIALSIEAGDCVTFCHNRFTALPVLPHLGSQTIVRLVPFRSQ